MQALLQIKLPYDLLVPDGAEYRVLGFERDGYRVLFDVPRRTDRPAAPELPDHLELNGQPAFLADVLALRFYKESFSRQESSPIDPPESLINYSLHSFLSRLKYVAKAPQVRPLEFPSCPWDLRYLQDDGSQLEETAGLVRGRGVGQFGITSIACDPKLWDLVFSLPHDFEPPAWHTLLVDARGALPHVGTAVVLAATALEVFVAEVLTSLAKDSVVPPNLWAWINDRGNWQKEPSVEEQFDVLLKVLAGHSLKEDNALWETLKSLRNARNSFVHDGAPKVGGTSLSHADAMSLIDRADKIVTAVRGWLPERLKWPVFEYSAELRFGKRLCDSQ